MGSKEFIVKCKELVKEYAKEHLDKSDEIPEFDVFVVWTLLYYFCPTISDSTPPPLRQKRLRNLI